MDEKTRTLIIYDIQDEKVRRKLSKCLKKYGNRVQKSAFEGWIDMGKYTKLMNEIKIFEADKSNDIRVYRMSGLVQTREINSYHSIKYGEFVIV